MTARISFRAPAGSRHLSALRRAGLARELDGEAFRDLLSDASGATSAERVAAALVTFYAADGDRERSLKRRRRDGFLGLRDDERLGASDVLRRLAQALPEVAGLRLRRRDGRPGLARGLRWEPLHGVESGTVAVDALVDAAHRLLPARWSHRLVRLDAPEGVEVYVRLDASRAAHLVESGLIEAPAEKSAAEAA